MTFSLIVATVGRAAELGRLLESLEDQSECSFDVIVVDQNSDDLIKPILDARPGLHILHLKSAPGLSRARNVGLTAATGDIVAFPDDDCWYPPDMLRRVSEAFAKHGSDGITIMARDESGAPCGGARWDTEAGKVDRHNVWRRAISIGLFVTSEAARSACGFDETLGAGSGTPFGAGEETDFVLRLLEGGRTIYFEPTIHALHPALRRGESEDDIRRAYAYGMGLGVVLRRHRYSVGYAAKGWLRSAGGMVLSAFRFQPRRARFYRAALMGKINGWRAGGAS